MKAIKRLSLTVMALLVSAVMIQAQTGKKNETKQKRMVVTVEKQRKKTFDGIKQLFTPPNVVVKTEGNDNGNGNGNGNEDGNGSGNEKGKTNPNGDIPKPPIK